MSTCFPFSQGTLAPESAQLLKKMDEEQEADEDVSDDDTEGREVPMSNLSPTAVRQRPVNPAAAAEKS